MKGPKTRSMPLTAAMVRFVDVAQLIKSRAAKDQTLRDLCDDYAEARATLTRLKKKRPRYEAEIDEYAVLVGELEDEVIHWLLAAEAAK